MKSPLDNQNHAWHRSDCLRIEVTTHCNSTCSHCFVRARGPKRSSLPKDLVRTLLGEGYEAGYRHLHLTGGEPLLWNALLDTFDHAFGLGYETAFLNTNGTLIDGGVSRRLAAYPDLTLSVSLQGPRRVHDRIRGKSSYDRALKGIETALSAGLKIHIFTTACRGLLQELPRFAEGLFRSFPEIKQLTLIQLIRVANDTFDLSKEVLTPEDFIRLVRMISLLNLYGFKIELLNNPLATVASRLLRMPWIPPSPPLYVQGSVMVMADLRVTLAHSTTEFYGKYEPGNLGSIMNSDEYRRAVSPDQSTCPTCAHSHRCAENGMVRPSEWYRDMFPEVLYCRRVLDRALSFR